MEIEFLHNLVIRVEFLRMMTFIKDNKRELIKFLKGLSKRSFYLIKGDSVLSE